MVQYSFSVSFVKEFPNQSVNFKETSHSTETILPKKIKEGCGNSATEENLVHNTMQYESSSKISIRLSHLARKS